MILHSHFVPIKHKDITQEWENSVLLVMIMTLDEGGRIYPWQASHFKRKIFPIAKRNCKKNQQLSASQDLPFLRIRDQTVNQCLDRFLKYSILAQFDFIKSTYFNFLLVRFSYLCKNHSVHDRSWSLESWVDVEGFYKSTHNVYFLF